MSSTTPDKSADFDKFEAGTLMPRSAYTQKRACGYEAACGIYEGKDSSIGEGEA